MNFQSDIEELASKEINPKLAVSCLAWLYDTDSDSLVWGEDASKGWASSETLEGLRSAACKQRRYCDDSDNCKRHAEDLERPAMMRMRSAICTVPEHAFTHPTILVEK